MQVRTGITPEGPAVDPGADSPTRSLRTSLEPAARWLGLVYLMFSLGGNILLRLQPATPQPWFERALLALAAAVLIVGVPRVVRTRVLWIPLFLLAVWIGAPALSTWALTGAIPLTSLQWTLILSALFIAAAVTRPMWSGWAILALGAVHIAANLAVYWKNYYSLGVSFPNTGLWSTNYGESFLPLPARGDWTGSASALGFPYPEGTLNRLVTLIVEVPQTLGYQYFGLSANPNYTGDYFAAFLVFAVAFLLRPTAVGLGGRARVALAVVLLALGLLLLYVLEARTALLAVLVGIAVLVVPVGRARRVVYPYVAAIATPLLLLAPPLLSWTTGASFTGRDCVWRSWSTAVRDSPVWGVGAPGHLTDVCPAQVFIVNAHNELLQAWSVGGLVGLFAFVGFASLVTWMAVRHSDLDGRVLLAVIAACLALLGLEVLSTDWAVAWLVPIVGRSLALYTGAEPISTYRGGRQWRTRRRAVT